MDQVDSFKGGLRHSGMQSSQSVCGGELQAGGNISALRHWHPEVGLHVLTTPFLVTHYGGVKWGLRMTGQL